jgi:hypothetical protein
MFDWPANKNIFIEASAAFNEYRLKIMGSKDIIFCSFLPLFYLMTIGVASRSGSDWIFSGGRAKNAPSKKITV